MLRSYIEQFQYKSVTTEDFVSFFKNFVSSEQGAKATEILKKIDFQKWIYEAGPSPIKFDDNLIEDIPEPW